MDPKCNDGAVTGVLASCIVIWVAARQSVVPPEYVSPIPPNMFSQCEGRSEGCFPRALLFLASFCPRCEVFFKAPEHFIPMRGVLLRGASHEPKDVFVSEGVLHVGAMGVALCREGGNPCANVPLACGS